ncbi:putative lipid II flippase FtsW [Nakamurella endophytica]|nr:putative lipid II flippase FtsW [Nakamurella endophytica]
MTSWHLILAVFALLLGFGLLMVLSASSIVSFKQGSGSAFATFESQAVYAVIGSVGFVFAARVSPRFIRGASFPAVLVSLFLLAAVLVIGKKINGARSWIGVGSATFQPSELAKVALLVWMAHVLAARRHTLRSLRSLLFPVLPVFVLMVALIMMQPDLGTTVSLCIVFFAVLWFAGAPMWIFGLLAAGGIAGVVYLSTSAGYRAARILAFLHPFDPAYQAWTYQVQQGWFGMGHGGLFGVGLGQSMVKWSWLPNADSDFIFAVIGEELGLIGTGLVLLLFGLLAYTGLRIARRSVEPWNKIVAAAATVWLVGQAAINIGYVVGLLPVTGIPLPMISAGGTSLVVTMLVFGLLANLARREPQAAAALYAQGPGRIGRFLGIDVQRPGDPRPPSRRTLRRRAAAARREAAQQERADRRHRRAEVRVAKAEAGTQAARRSREERAAAAARAARRPAPRRGASPVDPRRAGRPVADRGRPDEARTRRTAPPVEPGRRAATPDARRAPADPRRRAEGPDPRRRPDGTDRRPAGARTDPRRRPDAAATGGRRRGAPPELRRDGDRPSHFGDDGWSPAAQPTRDRRPSAGERRQPSTPDRRSARMRP